MAGCDYRRYSRGEDGEVRASERCGEPVRAFDVAFRVDQLEALLDGADDVAPVVVSYCAEHMTIERPTEPGWALGTYISGLVLLPLEGPRAPVGRS